MIRAIRKGFNVLRYHTQPRIRPETNGHHSANVAAICLWLDPDCSREVLIRALMHDVPEAYTGDVPYPFKADWGEIKQALEVGERYFIANEGIPSPDLSIDEEVMLKLADMLDLVMSCREEMWMGNKYAQEVYDRGVAYIESMPVDHIYAAKVREALA